MARIARENVSILISRGTTHLALRIANLAERAAGLGVEAVMRDEVLVALLQQVQPGLQLLYRLDGLWKGRDLRGHCFLLVRSGGWAGCSVLFGVLGAGLVDQDAQGLDVAGLR